MSSSGFHQIQFSDIAVIVAAKNEEKNILNCIKSILISADPADIIVVDDGSTDQTSAILKNFGSTIQLIQTNGVGPAAARNQAMQSTRKSYVAFVDADCLVDKSWLRSLVTNFQQRDPSFLGIGGAQKGFVDAGRWERFHVQFLEYVGFVSDYVHTGDQTREVNHNPTCNVLYRKDELITAGGFDEKLWPCEDLDLDIRLQKQGYRFLYTPQAIIYHHRPDSMMGFMKMMSRYGFGHAQIVKKHGLCQKIHALPFLTIGSILLITYSTIFFPALFKKLLNFGFLMILGLLLVAFLERSKSLMKKAIYVFYLIPSVLFWNLGFFAGLLQKSRITAK